MTADESLGWLHDSRLTALEVAWTSTSARVIIEVDTAAARAGGLPLAGAAVAADEPVSITDVDWVGTLVIECEGLERAVIPHEQPWGPSDYVNSVVVASEPAVLHIEMCSGDEIEIRASAITLNRERLRKLRCSRNPEAES